MTALLARLAQRLDFDLALLDIALPEAGSRHAALVPAVREELHALFRGTDVVMETRADRHRLQVLLPGTDLMGAQRVAANLHETLAKVADGFAEAVRLETVQLHARRGTAQQVAA
jgi:CheY-like chemotaxis protein